MTISTKPEDIDNPEVLLYYMESHPHSGENRAAAKLLRKLLSAAPLVAATAPIPNSQLKIIASLLGAAISDAEPSALRDVCIRVNDDLYRMIAQPVAVSDNEPVIDALETERMKLAACGVAAMQNTAESILQRISPDNPYYSASYSDVCAAVDREMALRTALAGQVAPQAIDNNNIKEEIIDVFRSCGFEVHENNEFDPRSPPMVYGPLDSGAILIDALIDVFGGHEGASTKAPKTTVMSPSSRMNPSMPTDFSDAQHYKNFEFSGVPQVVIDALDRMCTPLHETVLKGMTAEGDSYCMKVIRDYILSTSKADTGEIIREAVNAGLEMAVTLCEAEFKIHDKAKRYHHAQTAGELLVAIRALKSAAPSTIKADRFAETGTTIEAKAVAPEGLIERLRIHADNKDNTAFARSTMREVLAILAAPVAEALPVAAEKVLNTEQQYAIKEAHRISIGEEYFNARLPLMSPSHVRVFDDGFNRGYDAAMQGEKA